MKNWQRIIGFVVVTLVFVMAGVGCSALPSISSLGGQATPTAEAEIDLELAVPSVAIEGRLVPKGTVGLAFAISGQVSEVLVAEGDLVQTGDVIARLTGKEQLASSVAAAEFELFSAQQSRKSLDDDLDLARNQALQSFNQARQAVHDAERLVNGIGLPATQADIEIANSQVIFAANALEKAQDNFDKVKNLPENNLQRARLQIELSNAQKAYDAAVLKYNGLVSTTGEFERQQRLTNLEIAEGQLALAQKTVDTLAAGPDPDAVAGADARILAAEARLAAAQADLSKLDLVATQNGKILDFDLVAGQAVAAGAPVLQIVDFSEWDVETENLTEIEVVDVTVGQMVTIIPDALPKLKLAGEVISISDTFAEKRGEITYTVKIKLAETDPLLRWGMTVVVDFK